MRTHYSKINLIVWIMTYLVPASHGTTLGKYFSRVNLRSVSHYNVFLLETKNNVKNKMWCGTYCLQYKCQCASFIYVSQTKTCNMYVRRLNEHNEGVVGYVKNTDCTWMIPSPDNALLIDTYSACRVTYTCPFGYIMIGVDTVQCQDNEEWDQFDTVCQLIRCPNLDQPLLDGSYIYVWMMQSGDVFGDIAIYTLLHDRVIGGCYQRDCQSSGIWSSLKVRSTQQDGTCGF